MRKLKAGIVGCGGIANGKHLPAMKKSGLYEIVAHRKGPDQKCTGEPGTGKRDLAADHKTG